MDQVRARHGFDGSGNHIIKPEPDWQIQSINFEIYLTNKIISTFLNVTKATIGRNPN
jgi:hypothetical protein